MSELCLLDRLIAEFESRARTIARDLASRYDYVASDRYVSHFVLLHTDHIQFLRTGDFMAAYNLLKSIGRLSERMEKEENKLRSRAANANKRLKLRDERFRRGPIVCCYVAGDFRQFSPQFDSNLSKLMCEDVSILKIGTWSWSRGQLNAAAVYNRLAEFCAESRELEPEDALSRAPKLSEVPHRPNQSSEPRKVALGSRKPPLAPSIPIDA